jgi:hypothetical protein
VYPLSSISLFIMPTGLNPSFACQGFPPPLYSHGRASSTRYHACWRVWLSVAGMCWEWCQRSAPAAASEIAPPGSHAPARGSAAATPTSSGVVEAEEVPTTPMATTASTTVMPSSTPSTAEEEVPTAPTPAIEGDAGGASSSIPPPTLEETEVVFGRWLRSDAEPEAALGPLPQVLSRAHQALHETEAAIL